MNTFAINHFVFHRGLFLKVCLSFNREFFFCCVLYSECPLSEVLLYYVLLQEELWEEASLESIMSSAGTPGSW